MGSIVAIVGRPNVGKSTFFNRMTESRDAIEDPTSGVTRDRNYGKCNWGGKEFSIVDTGGYIEKSDDRFEAEIKKQVKFAIDEANIILFLVDTMEGLTPLDMDVSKLLRKTTKKVFVVANKVDNNKLQDDANEFYKLGTDKVYCISSMSGSGTGDLLDDVVKEIEQTVEEEVPDIPRFTVVGRPNVGKSSLINALLGEDRNIVTEIAGTTRDSIYTKYNKFGFEFLIVDTAGLRKKTKVHEDVEFYSVMRSIRAIEKSDVCLFMIDATQGMESQDVNIFWLIQKNKKGIVIVVNKWDLVEKDTKTHKAFEDGIYEKISPFRDVPIIFTSVTNKQRIFKTLEAAKQVYLNRKKVITTHKLNDVLLPLIAQTPPPTIKGKYIKIKFVTQLPTQTPSFAFFCSHPQYVKDPYKRFLENKIRENFDFTGTPIQIYCREK